jgi:undecaprenyl-diphosphatase
VEAIRLEGNIHAVVPGRFYRSAQLDKGQFARVIARDSIRSILNLRGAHPTAPWYHDELAVADSLGVTHYDFGLSATHLVTPAQIDSILTIVRRAPKPMLVHCEGGADRSGLVSAFYAAVIVGQPKQQADEQLSLRFGHFPWLGSKTWAMDSSYWAYVRGTRTMR